MLRGFQQGVIKFALITGRKPKNIPAETTTSPSEGEVSAPIIVWYS